ncbi:hypothetical protein T440DRAFT_469441 [Plenodomus tracheiphilus IPT5]|uniref:Uncharacterized protein n=1 Tax=Plenodomus tracheiphilus IPT5 TaxID=1408161 RepID=A0A6A7B4H3_9PLEO|nr:hypothetical protein T440DRAFT_469441 [Plenodomus tracheiphilus IPT5]
MDRIEALTAELEAIRLTVPKNECIYTEILRYYACGHDTKESCSTKGTPREKCQYKQTLGTDCDEICPDCQTQEKVNYEAATTRLTTAHAAQERIVNDMRRRIQSLEELIGDQERLAETATELTHLAAVTEGPSTSQSPSQPSERYQESDTLSLRGSLRIVEMEQSLGDLHKLQGETLVEEVAPLEMLESRHTEESIRGVPCFATMVEHLNRGLVDTNAQGICVSTPACGEDDQSQGDKSREQSPGSVTVTEDRCTCIGSESQAAYCTAKTDSNSRFPSKKPSEARGTSTICSKSEAGSPCAPYGQKKGRHSWACSRWPSMVTS